MKRLFFLPRKRRFTKNHATICFFLVPEMSIPLWRGTSYVISGVAGIALPLRKRANRFPAPFSKNLVLRVS